jgi:hypothetical protein
VIKFQELVLQRDLIKSVAERWKAQYAPNENWNIQYGEGKRQIYDRLLALDTDNCTAEDVVRIIGNTSWTTIRCDYCECYERGQQTKAKCYIRFDNHRCMCNVCLANYMNMVNLAYGK